LAQRRRLRIMSDVRHFQFGMMESMRTKPQKIVSDEWIVVPDQEPEPAMTLAAFFAALADAQIEAQLAVIEA
jgi:hypothetical protein